MFTFAYVLLLSLISPCIGQSSEYQGPFVFPSHSEREDAQVYLPASYDGQKELPIVLLLHGYTSSGSWVNYYMGFNERVSSREFILVVPNGIKDPQGNRYWNATDGCCDFAHKNNDDVAYLSNLLKEVGAKFKVDTKKVFVIGHSNGGFMAHRMACERGEQIAGIASLAGLTFKNPADCKTRSPIKILQIHAADDPTVKFMGDERGFPHMAPYPGAEETVEQWAHRNQCMGDAENGPSLDLTHSIPGTDVETRTWRNCSGQSKVSLWTIHTYSSFLHKPHVPLVNNQFAESVLDFFSISEN